MQRSEILAGIQEIVRDVLDNDDVVLSDTTTADAVPGWDSLMHVRILVAVEKRFNVRFDVEELGEMANVGMMVKSVQALQ